MHRFASRCLWTAGVRPEGETRGALPRAAPGALCIRGTQTQLESAQDRARGWPVGRREKLGAGRTPRHPVQVGGRGAQGKDRWMGLNRLQRRRLWFYDIFKLSFEGTVSDLLDVLLLVAEICNCCGTDQPDQTSKTQLTFSFWVAGAFWKLLGRGWVGMGHLGATWRAQGSSYYSSVARPSIPVF